jgi:glucosyl-3-phosphoglycerate synthase
LEDGLERWFKERTYHHGDFSDIGRLVDTKQSQGLTISVCLPTLNVAGTVGRILEVFRTELVERHPLIDQLAIVDSRSTDATVEISRGEGAQVIFDDEILTGMEPASGKGEALWKSLFALTGDIIAWVDSDIENIHPRFAYGIIGPLLVHPEVGYVKAFYQRPLRDGGTAQPSGGGRVTELTVRPVLNLFYPELSGLIQPLSGEYAGRRTIFESIPFLTGYGVETGMLLDVYERYGIWAFGQTDLEVRVHHNQPINSLSKMSFGILQALFGRLERDGKLSLKAKPGTVYNTITRDGDGYSLEPAKIEVWERPPMASIPEYAAKLGRPS